jgi:hypothetical protein
MTIVLANFAAALAVGFGWGVLAGVWLERWRVRRMPPPF